MLKRAESGIGTLIVFIAMILVAAVAAGVLIQTSSNLQSKSLEIGKKTGNEVGKNINIIQAFGEVQELGAIKNMTYIIKLDSGSGSEKLENLIINMQLSDGSVMYSKGLGLDCTGYNESNFNCNYSVSFIKKIAKHIDGYMQEGEVVQISLVSPRNINESESINLLWRLNDGMSKSLSISTPNSIGGNRVYLYP